MPDLIFSVEVVVGIVVAVVVGYFLAVILRRRAISRGRLLAMCAYAREGTHGWRNGFIRFGEGDVEWYPMGGISVRPKHAWSRRSLDLGTPVPVGRDEGLDFIDDGVSAVSYTHLDVYKRQRSRPSPRSVTATTTTSRSRRSSCAVASTTSGASGPRSRRTSDPTSRRPNSVAREGPSRGRSPRAVAGPAAYPRDVGVPSRPLGMPCAWVGSVSYTHLDVYKRQGQMNALRQYISCLQLNRLQAEYPVLIFQD